LSKAATESGNMFMRSIAGLSETEKGNIALQDASFATILNNQADPDIVNNVIITKSGFLFALMKGAVGPDKFDEFIHKYIETQWFKAYSIDDLNEKMVSSFNMDLNHYLPDWYNSKTLPGYIVSKVETIKIKQEEAIKTMVSFIITNTEKDPGAVSVTFRMGGGQRGGFRMRGGGGSEDNLEKTILIEGKVSKKITYILNKEPRMMTFNTYASHNIPSSINQQFGKIEIDEKIQGKQGEEIVAYTEGTEPNEIIQDNEDVNFKVSAPKSSSLIQKIFMPKDESALASSQKEKYKGIVFWNVPVEWTLTTNDIFYGKQIRSAYYLKGGTGDRKATWSIPLKAPGYYKVSAFIPKMRRGGGPMGEEKTDEEYNFTIFHDDGEDKQVINMKDNDTGWIEIGSYHLSPDTVKIELSNLSKARFIFADAIKLVKEN
jgi:hypothetical protein